VEEYKVDDPTWAEWTKARKAKEEWTRDIVSWRRIGQKVRITRSGPHLSGGARGPRAQALSQYYFLLDDFDPVAGHPKGQQHLAIGLGPESAYVDRAKHNREIYDRALKWGALKVNLRVNKLFTIRQIAHLDAHYAFLSAFVHPTMA